MSDGPSSEALEAGASGLVALALEFDLPFPLLVADGFGPRRSLDYVEFQFTAHGLPITLRFARVLRTEKSAIIDLSRPQEAASHSRVQMWFDGPAIEERTGSADYRGHVEDLIDLAVEAVNRYVTLYREVTGAFWLRALTRRDIPEFAFVGVLQDGRKLTLMYETPSEPDAPGPLSPEAEQTLRDRFASAYEPDAMQSLAFTVRDLYARGEYWQAAMAVSLLCEARIARSLQGGSSLEGLIPAVTDPASPIGAAYARYRETVGVFRDLVARGESPPIREEEAGQAIVAVWALLEEVGRALRRESEGQAE